MAGMAKSCPQSHPNPSIRKESTLVVDPEELEEMDASEIHAKRLNAKEVTLSKSGENYVFPVAGGIVKPPGGNQALNTHFPNDRNCEICQRTKITRAPCRRRIGGVVPRAENFGDLITAAHKILSDGCESRNNHRYAIVVQDLAAQWIQSYPCKTQTSQETQRNGQKFLESSRKRESHLH